MPVTVIIPGGGRQLQRLRVQHFDALRTIKTLKVMDGGVLKLVGNFYGDVVASVTPTNVTGVGPSGYVTTNTAVVSATGGAYPYTYAWSLVSFSGPAAPYAISANARNTPFRGMVDTEAVFRCEVTDTLGTKAYATVYATFASNL